LLRFENLEQRVIVCSMLAMAKDVAVSLNGRGVQECLARVEESESSAAAMAEEEA